MKRKSYITDNKSLIRRLATASFRVRNKHEDYDEPTDIDLHADNDWARAEAVLKEYLRITKKKPRR